MNVRFNFVGIWAEFDQSSDQVDSVLDNLPVLSEENEEEADSNDITSDTYVITSDDYETLRNKGLINTSSGDNASVIYGGSDNSEQSPRNLIGANSENNLSNQSEDESKTEETITDGLSLNLIFSELFLFPSVYTFFNVTREQTDNCYCTDNGLHSILRGGFSHYHFIGVNFYGGSKYSGRGSRKKQFLFSLGQLVSHNIAVLYISIAFCWCQSTHSICTFFNSI